MNNSEKGTGFLHVEVYVFTLILAFTGYGICLGLKWYLGTWMWWFWIILGLFSIPAAFFWLIVFPWVIFTGVIDWFKKRC